MSSAPHSGDLVCELRPCAPRRTRAGLAPHWTPELGCGATGGWDFGGSVSFLGTDAGRAGRRSPS